MNDNAILKISIIPMNMTHIAEVVQMEKLCFSMPWSQESYEESLNNPQITLYAAVDASNTLVGYAGILEVMDEGELITIAVSPQSRRMGIAHTLINHIFSHCLEENIGVLYLEVRDSNEGAHSLYLQEGFVEVGTRVNYYKSPIEDAIIMAKLLPGR